MINIYTEDSQILFPSLHTQHHHATIAFHIYLYAYGYHAKCVYFESTEQATISVLIFLNCSALSLNAMISVGHTKVLQNKIRIL